MIAGIGLGQGLELARRLPIEVSAVDQNTTEGEAVTAEPLGRRMHHDIGTQLDRAAEVGAGKGTVDHQRQAVAMGHLCQGRDIQNLEAGIAEDLGIDQPGLRANRRLEGSHIARVDEARRDPEARQRVGEEVHRAAIKR